MIQDTSLEAREHVKKSLNDRALKVLHVIESNGPLTLFEIARILHVPDHTISGRLTELSEAGKIEDSGVRRKTPTSGRNAIVWRLQEPRRAENPSAELPTAGIQQAFFPPKVAKPTYRIV